MSGRRRNHLLWLGPLVTLIGALSYFMVFARFPATRDFPWVNLPLVALGLVLSGVAVWRAFVHRTVWRGRVLGTAVFVFSLLLALAFNLYVFSLSYMLPDPTALTLELEQAPDFTLADHTGGEVRLADLRGRKVVLVFYRGFW